MFEVVTICCISNTSCAFTGIFPIAVAVVSSEDKDNWNWFMIELKKVLLSDMKYTFISDRNSGLLEAMNNVFSDHFHSYCMFHLKLNLLDKMKRKDHNFKESVLYKFRECAYAPNVVRFEEKLKSLREEGGKIVQDWVDKVPIEHWANAYFARKRYGEMCSNVAESFNAKIKDTRHLPIVNLINKIRIEVMK